jgi:hypothetical protein
MSLPRLTFSLLSESYAICRLGPGDPLPPWAATAPFHAITRTPDELSIVCLDQSIPVEVTAERGWKVLRVSGPLPFTQTGVLASIAQPLADKAVSLFVISTYDTDYVLVKQHALDQAISALQAQGHRFL